MKVRITNVSSNAGELTPKAIKHKSSGYEFYLFQSDAIISLPGGIFEVKYGDCILYGENDLVEIKASGEPLECSLISYKSAPGGGTTDYAVDIFIQALKSQSYTCYLKPDAKLPMMYMSDAIRATIEIMQAPRDNIKVRSSYNLSGISFDPEELAAEIKREIPNFSMNYAPDFRQEIAESWPNSVDDSFAKNDWNWENKIKIQGIVKKMLDGLS